MDIDDQHIPSRTIGFHPCVGKTAAGEDRPTSVVIRTPDGKHAMHEFGEQSLLDFFTCGAPLGWREAMFEDVDASRPPHHYRWEDVSEEEYEAYVPVDIANIEEEQSKLFYLKRHKRSGEIVAWRRLQVPTGLITLDPKSDIVGVANGGLGYQIMDILLGRYPEMDVRVIGSGTLKERRKELDELLPKKVRSAAIKVRLASEKKPGDKAKAKGETIELVEVDEALTDVEAENDEAEEVSKSKAKDANAKFDAHRIAYALGDAEAVKLFDRCTLRNRDWAGVSIAYGMLEVARKARVAAEQQFRQAHRMQLRSLIKDLRVPYVTLSNVTVDEEDQSIKSLLAAYESTLRICVADEKKVAKKLEALKQSYARIEGARVHEEEMEKHLELALAALPEYTEFLVKAKGMVHAESGLPLGKFIGERIFGRWIAGFGSPMSSRLHEPMRLSDQVLIGQRRTELTESIAALDRSGLPMQPSQGGGKTREWLLACERLSTLSVQQSEGDVRVSFEAQLTQVKACKAAYRKLDNAKKGAKNRPLNRVIAFMGLHVMQGGKYAEVKPEFSFPRRRKGGRANWNERLLRQGAYQWATLIIKGTPKGPDSHWKTKVYLPYKERLIAAGEVKGHAHKRAVWRMTTVAVRWLINEWFDWERSRAQAVTPSSSAVAA